MKQMKRKPDLFVPNEVDKEFQMRMTEIVSSTPSRKAVETMMPKLKQLEEKMRKRRSKEELQRLIKE